VIVCFFAWYFILQLVEFYSAHPELYPVTLVDRKPEFIRLKKDVNDMKNDEEFKRFCGAGHEMMLVDIDGTVYPCHRFSKGISQRYNPLKVPNRQAVWKPDECEKCKLIEFCPTCAGFNFEISGDSGLRTTYHCEAFKLEVLASQKLYALKIEQNPPDFDKLPDEEAATLKRRIDAILEIDKYGFF